MKVFVILSCVALAVAKPQGYSYSPPSSGSSSSHFGLSGPAPSFQPPSFAPAPQFSPTPTYAAPAPTYAAPAPTYAAPAPTYSSPPSFAPIPQYSAPAPAPQYSAPAPAPQYSAPAPAPQYSAPAPAPQFSPSPQFAPQQQQNALVQKHIYVHVPPPDQEEAHHQQFGAPVAPPQKHYKIIFIKAPSPPSYSRVQQQLQAQTEEKTLVYVLVKKPESLEEIQQAIPQQPHTPSKPEVYFIKYKAQKEQGQQQQPQYQSAPQQQYQPAPQPQALPQDSGSGIQSLPLAPQKPAPVYGPAH